MRKSRSGTNRKNKAKRRSLNAPDGRAVPPARNGRQSRRNDKCSPRKSWDYDRNFWDYDRKNKYYDRKS